MNSGRWPGGREQKRVPHGTAATADGRFQMVEGGCRNQEFVENLGLKRNADAMSLVLLKMREIQQNEL